MPVNVVQPMVTLESFLPASTDMKCKELELTRQFYEKQMELLKSLKSSFYPENEESLNNSQVSVLSRPNSIIGTLFLCLCLIA